jgi:hypothetical protein
MPARPQSCRRRRGAARWSALVFLVCFTLLLIGVASYVLVPAFEKIDNAAALPDPEKRKIVAFSRLLLLVLLFILFAGLVLTFRFGRLFFPRPVTPRTKTQYVDAWAEAGRRAEAPSGEDDDDDDDEPPGDDDK